MWWTGDTSELVIVFSVPILILAAAYRLMVFRVPANFQARVHNLWNGKTRVLVAGFNFVSPLEWPDYFDIVDHAKSSIIGGAPTLYENRLSALVRNEKSVVRTFEASTQDMYRVMFGCSFVIIPHVDSLKSDTPRSLVDVVVDHIQSVVDKFAEKRTVLAVRGARDEFEKYVREQLINYKDESIGVEISQFAVLSVKYSDSAACYLEYLTREDEEVARLNSRIDKLVSKGYAKPDAIAFMDIISKRIS